ncbi:stalk domain-containing protein [Demequina muriae]|uniref:Copper amine oxidase-like N-terminal domain-containing protein n=1 Tax=Demequina muriae TaxID=3051664 RepID=A0ABT8GGL1_9MICO|nr:stalk domain-containing protein [Demequina sp. EGI L300058]MDN4480565.1 hypothetical protein [Demequina sp. EGI L300058]
MPSTKITLIPGTPDDDNRDYLPEAIKGSDIVVNENGNNSHPYPEGLQEHTGEVIEGTTDTWFTYVPSSYDGSAPVPLVVSMHGGLMTGWGQAIYTSWTLLAEREGFICLFPNAHQRRFWLIEVADNELESSVRPNDSGVFLNPPPRSPEDNHDLAMVRRLIGRMRETYAIDGSRIFMQGMSMGNLMTDQFTRHFGDILAGAAGSGGPTSPALLFDENDRPVNAAGPVAIWQSRLDLDAVPPQYTSGVSEVVRRNREYWLEINGVQGRPQIAIEGESNFAFYEGDHAPVVFRDVFNRDHGQTFDDAELVWDYLFSGTRRGDEGSIQVRDTISPRVGDSNAVAIAENRALAWVDNEPVEIGGVCFRHDKLKYHGLDGGELVRGSYLYVPVRFLASAFGAVVDSADDGLVATLTFANGTTVELARGIVGAVVDGRLRSMYAEAVHRDGQLWISLEWLCDDVLGLRTTTNGSVLYVSERHARLSKNMADLIDDLLTV